MQVHITTEPDSDINVEAFRLALEEFCDDWATEDEEITSEVTLQGTGEEV